MKGKLLASLALISMVSTSGFAMDIHNGKLINHREWTTDNHVNLTVKNIQKKMNTNVLSKLKNSNSKPSDEIILSDDMLAESGIVGTETTLFSSNEVYIFNYSSSTHTYMLETDICAQVDSSGNMACGIMTDQFTLDPLGYVNLDRAPRLGINYDAAGEYTTYITTIAQRDDQTTLFRTFSENTVEIFDSQKA